MLACGSWQVLRWGLLTRTHAMLVHVHHTHRLLASNQLRGSIPDSIGNLAQLQTLCVVCCVFACVVELACGFMGSGGMSMVWVWVWAWAWVWAWVGRVGVMRV